MTYLFYFPSQSPYCHMFSFHHLFCILPISPKHTFIWYAQLDMSKCLSIFVPKFLSFFGIFCLKIVIPLKSTITSATLNFQMGCKVLNNHHFADQSVLIFQSLSQLQPFLSGWFILSLKCRNLNM